MDGAAAGFALQLAASQFRDWRKRRRLTGAYRNAAAETIEHCRSKGYAVRSEIWNAVSGLLRSAERAKQIASWYASRAIDTAAFNDMTGDDPVVG